MVSEGEQGPCPGSVRADSLTITHSPSQSRSIQNAAHAAATMPGIYDITYSQRIVADRGIVAPSFRTSTRMGLEN